MPESNDSTRDPELTGDDCPLPVARQNRNIACYAIYWAIFYLAAPVSYVGLTHANLLKALGYKDTVCNLPNAIYSWMSVVPVLTAWFLPQARHSRTLALAAIGAMTAITAAVAGTLASGASASVVKWIVLAHSAVFGAGAGVLITALWDLLRRGVSTSRRGRALGAAFGIGPLFACVGALLQDALFDGKLLGGRSFGLEFPANYMAMFAAAAPLMALAGLVIASFTLPGVLATAPRGSTADPQTTWREVATGLKQFLNSRSVIFAVVIYVIVYSGSSIMVNVSLHAKDVLGPDSNTLGIQTFLRFGFKAVAGAGLGWLLSASNPRATLITTTSVVLLGVVWALFSSGWWFMLAFGLMGAGELFGAHFPNYVTTASQKPYVRLNMAYLSLLSVLIGFSQVAFGAISKQFGRPASFNVAAGMLVLALILIGLLLPADPTPREKSPDDVGRG